MKRIKVQQVIAIIGIFIAIMIFNMNNNEVESAYISYSIDSIDNNKYPGFKEKLQKLKEQYPNWKIKILYTGIDWKYAIKNENTGHGESPKSLIYDTFDEAWRCQNILCQNKKYDVSKRWYCSSEEAIKYMMDPRNSLDPAYIFQFQDLSSSVGDREAVKKMTEGTFLYNDSYINAIIEAAKKEGISPFHIIARMKLEQGTSGTGAMNGYVYRNEAGEYVKVYNLFNINVSGNDTELGLLAGAKYAYENGWFSVEDSIKGGSKFIKEQYINRGQTTLYFQKYNVVEQGNLFNHQYMQNIRAANDEGNSMYKAYLKNNILSSSFEFTIPIYENMPVSPASRPYKISVDSITTEKEVYTVNINETGDIGIKFNPSNATNKSLIWESSNSEVVRIWDGHFRGLKEGIATITATTKDGSKVANCKVVVRDSNKKYVQSIKIEKAQYVSYINEAFDINYSCSPSDAINTELNWTTPNSDIIRVYGNRYRGLKEGTATIVATTDDGAVKATCQVIIRNQNKSYIDEIKLEKKEYITYINEAIDIPFSYTPEDAINAEFEWISSDTDIIRVWGNRFRALKEGTAEVIVKTLDGTVEERIKVMVRNPDKLYVRSINIEKSEYLVNVNEAIDIPFSYTPEDAINAEFEWISSDTNIIRVWGNRFRALKEGTAEVIVKTLDGTVEKRIKVIVQNTKDDNVERVETDQEEYNIKVDEAVDVNYTYMPSDATNAEFYWGTTNPEVIRVYGNRFRGLKEGTAELIVKTVDGKYEKRIKVTVKNSKNTKVEKIKTDQEEYTINVDEAVDVGYTYTPNNATNAEFYWGTTNPEIIRVYGNRFRGLKEGTAELIVKTTDGTVEKRIKIIVQNSKNTNVEKVETDQEEYVIKVDEAVDVRYTYMPISATNAEFYWGTTNPEIIRVYGNRFRGLKEGTTELIVKTVDGKYEKRIKVTVIN